MHFWKLLWVWRITKFLPQFPKSRQTVSINLSPLKGFMCGVNLFSHHFTLLEPSVSYFFQCSFTLGGQKTEQKTRQMMQIPKMPQHLVHVWCSLSCSTPIMVKCAVDTHHRPPSRPLFSAKLASPARTWRKYNQVLQESGMGRKCLMCPQRKLQPPPP